MTEIDAEVKKWGNSLGIRVPAALAHEQGIEPGDRVHVKIEKLRRPDPSFFGGGRKYLEGVDLHKSLAKARLEDERTFARKTRDLDRAIQKDRTARR